MEAKATSLLQLLLLPITNVYSATLLPALLVLAVPPSPRASPAQAAAAFLWMGAVPCAFFYATALVFYLLDTLPPRAWRAQHKWQGAAGLPAPGAYAAVLLVSLRSWFVGLCFVLLLCRSVAPALGAPPASAPWRPLDFFCQLPLYVLAVDACFWATHRALHSRLLYAPIHRQHHAFPAPFALAAVHAHPFEHLFSNVLSISLGPLLCRAHPVSAALWGCLASFSTLNSHSGFRFAHISEAHDWHHRFGNECFGAGHLADYLLGTSARFRAHRAQALAEGARKGSE
jgi:sterol desaturase/sphingolipid hydroxylase (fatty acid hydroxylase superfamily)